MRRASSRVLTSPTSRRSPSQIANCAIDADSGIGNKYVPSRVAPVSLRNTCSTWVVATWELIFVSILIDLIGRARGKGTGGRGPSGQRRQGPGTMIPWALAIVANPETIESRRKSRIILVRIETLHTQRVTLLTGVERRFRRFLRPG